LITTPTTSVALTTTTATSTIQPTEHGEPFLYIISFDSFFILPK